MKLFSVKESKNINGKKTTITINTEDPQIIKNLLDSVPADKEQKKASSKKDSIKAKVKEVKPKTTAKAKGSKGKATKAKAPGKPKALPAPKVKTASKRLKGYIYKSTDKKLNMSVEIVIYSCNKKDADKLIALYKTKSGREVSYLRVKELNKLKVQPIASINENNYYEWQKNAILNYQK